MADERDDIRARIDLVELVGQKVALKRAGKHWKGLCPFHDDRNPSFTVSPDFGRYQCWSCGAKGDVFDWVMKTENLEFREALEMLAKRAGITLKPRTGEASKSELEERAAAMDEALRFFRDSLKTAAAATQYCDSRGLTQEVRDQWELGLNPEFDGALANYLSRKKHSLTLCKTLFLVEEDGRGGFYDKFRGRLMFPIRDERGQLVAFGGRILGSGQPKYINSGDTPIYRKSRVLYGLHLAKQRMLETRRAVLVEGYLDVIACHRAGVDNAVASLGTALAEDQARLLKRWCDHATILYDGDEAGQKAAERGCEILRVAGIQASVALLPAGDDPDTLLKRDGPHAVKQAAAAGITPLAFTLHRLEMREDPGGAPFWAEAIAALAACDSPAELESHVTNLAAKYMRGQPESTARTTLYSRITNFRRAARPKGGSNRAVVHAIPFSTGMNPPEAFVFQAFAGELLRRQAWEAIRESGLLWSEAARTLGAAIVSAFPASPPTGLAREWIGTLEDPEIQTRLADIEFFAGYQTAGKPVEDASSEPALEAAVATLRRQREERQIGEIKRGDPSDEKLADIMKRLKNLKSEPN